MEYLKKNYHKLLFWFFLGLFFSCGNPNSKLKDNKLENDSIVDTSKITKGENIK